MSNNRVHDKHVQTIARTPQVIGLDNIIMSTGEVYLFETLPRYKGDLVGSPDNLCFDVGNRTIYNIEYKCNADGVEHGKRQTLRNYGVLNRIFPSWEIVDLVVHGDYKVEEVKYI